MAFKDNLGIAEELKVEMVDCTPSSLTIERDWLMHVMQELVLLRPLEGRPRLDALIEEIRQKLQ